MSIETEMLQRQIDLLEVIAEKLEEANRLKASHHAEILKHFDEVEGFLSLVSTNTEPRHRR